MKPITTALAVLVLSSASLVYADSADNPFSRQDSELLSAVWPKIRDANSFSSIDWRDVGLSGPPGDATARRVMADHWSQLRTAADFDDIDWTAIRDGRGSRGYGDRGDRDRDYDARSSARNDRYGPFTRDEARELAAVWPKIRVADDFDDIDWDSVGLDHAPGDRDARRLMAKHWDSLKRAQRFDDIDWRDLDD